MHFIVTAVLAQACFVLAVNVGCPRNSSFAGIFTIENKNLKEIKLPKVTEDSQVCINRGWIHIPDYDDKKSLKSSSLTLVNSAMRFPKMRVESADIELKDSLIVVPNKAKYTGNEDCRAHFCKKSETKIVSSALFTDQFMIGIEADVNIIGTTFHGSLFVYKGSHVSLTNVFGIIRGFYAGRIGQGEVSFVAKRKIVMDNVFVNTDEVGVDGELYISNSFVEAAKLLPRKGGVLKISDVNIGNSSAELQAGDDKNPGYLTIRRAASQPSDRLVWKASINVRDNNTLEIFVGLKQEPLNLLKTVTIQGSHTTCKVHTDYLPTSTTDLPLISGMNKRYASCAPKVLSVTTPKPTLSDVGFTKDPSLTEATTKPEGPKRVRSCSSYSTLEYSLISISGVLSVYAIAITIYVLYKKCCWNPVQEVERTEDDEDNSNSNSN